MNQTHIKLKYNFVETPRKFIIANLFIYVQPRPQGHLCGRGEETDDPGKGFLEIFEHAPSVNNVALTQVTTSTEHWRANFHNVYRNLRSYKNNI